MGFPENMDGDFEIRLLEFDYQEELCNRDCMELMLFNALLLHHNHRAMYMYDLFFGKALAVGVEIVGG